MQQPAGDSIDPLFTPYFKGLDEAVLRFPHCRACGRFHWYPLPLCPHCRSDDVEWKRVSGEATIFTWTVVHHAFDRDFHLKPPYIVALLEFHDAPGVRLVANIVGDPVETIAIGQSVKPEFGRRDGQAYVQFRIVAS